ncbi:ABC transporter permease [Rhodococcus ruber]|nr:ABC transporter permease [Rhodococcus ruber]
MTSIVNLVRDLLTGQPVAGDLWVATGWCAGILVASYTAAVMINRRKFS